ncbi:transglycosylase SLT domain-containing protein [Streptomyces sp. NBC_01808]|uniref:transglycosylase SLT domain-containing protein n=1 Tax=Streptomyces sp. NBC_01808 TaxID=2975947 RepID=UPI002DD9C961|nr:transglycosylase SLT domain-containing protein [Streptomyces sp. NBC_01808]WSA40274.1 transglycosylase SLT domain-containing protein [Streptomyces sp. NBC_01808]
MAEDEGKSSDPVTLLLIFGTGITGLGCVSFIIFIILFPIATFLLLGIAKTFWPLVIFCKIFPVCDSGGGGDGGGNDEISLVVEGNGRQELYSPSVPVAWVTEVRDAGRECTEIGPIVIAAQIQFESGWNEKLLGPNGEEGLSQLPADKFDEFGGDADDDDEDSRMDPEDSIAAQGKYMCSLAEEIGVLLDNGQVEGDPLDLALAAYDVGLDVIKDAKGIPEGSETNGYVYGIRSLFPLYAGVEKPPDGETYPSPSPFPSEPGDIPDGF